MSSLRDTLNKLRTEVGKHPTINLSKKFENWGKTQKAELLVTRPETVEQVQSVIKAAKKINLKVCHACMGNNTIY